MRGNAMRSLHLAARCSVSVTGVPGVPGVPCPSCLEWLIQTQKQNEPELWKDPPYFIIFYNILWVNQLFQWPFSMSLFAKVYRRPGTWINIMASNWMDILLGKTDGVFIGEVLPKMAQDFGKVCFVSYDSIYPDICNIYIYILWIVITTALSIIFLHLHSSLISLIIIMNYDLLCISLFTKITRLPYP